MVALDIVSLQIVAAVGSLLAGAIHFIPGLTSQDRGGWARWWGAGKLLIGITNALTLMFDGSNVAFLERLLNFALVIGLILCVHSVAVFGGRRLARGIVIAIALMVAMIIALMLFDTEDVRWSIAALGMTRMLCHFAVAWLAFGIARREKLLTAWIMTALFAATVPLFLLRTTFLLASLTLPSWEMAMQMSADWMVGIAIILVSLSHFSLLLLDAERTQGILREQACRDGLTGALNRNGLSKVEHELRGEAVLLLIDIDHFKALNDGQGHAAGDTILRLVVDLAQHTIGQRGLVVRIGGDAFLCGLPGTGRAEAEAILTQLSERFDRAVGAMVDSTPCPALSIGLASGSVADGLDALIHRADEAMYAVKRQHHAATARAA